jgi:hypothetical protein
MKLLACSRAVGGDSPPVIGKLTYTAIATGTAAGITLPPRRSKPSDGARGVHQATTGELAVGFPRER